LPPVSAVSAAIAVFFGVALSVDLAVAGFGSDSSGMDGFGFADPIREGFALPLEAK
jgi:hypothetical protein